MRAVASESMRAAAAREYCRSVLPRVSRTFALNIRLLQGPLGDAVLLGYLFCRIADTVEDSPHLALQDKPELLTGYANLFPTGDDTRARAAAWARSFAPLAHHGEDHALCLHAETVFEAFATLPSRFRAPVEDCVREMALGMQRFAARRAADPSGRLRLETLADLEQ